MSEVNQSEMEKYEIPKEDRELMYRLYGFMNHEMYVLDIIKCAIMSGKVLKPESPMKITLNQNTECERKIMKLMISKGMLPTNGMHPEELRQLMSEIETDKINRMNNKK